MAKSKGITSSEKSPYYEMWMTKPKNDEMLLELNVEIWAASEILDGKVLRDVIIFKRRKEDLEYIIDCTKTVKDFWRHVKEKEKQDYINPNKIALDQHFRGICALTERFIENGIIPEIFEWVGQVEINPPMERIRNQFIDALIVIAPELALKLLTYTFEELYIDYSDKIISSLIKKQGKVMELALALLKGLKFPEKVLKQLAKETEPTFRIAIAENEHLSKEIVDELSNDPDSRVRLIIASRKDLPKKLLTRLASDDSAKVRAVAESKIFDNMERQEIYPQFIMKSEKLPGESPDHYYYEQWQLPFNDEKLLEAGVEIGARTEVQEYRVKSNKIVFRRGNRESSVDCVHVIVGKMELQEDGHQFNFNQVSTEREPELAQLLSPEDHYIALKSFMQGLIELGVQDTIITSINAELESGESPIDINHYMRTQLIKALISVAPAECIDLIKYLLERYYVLYPRRFRYLLFDENWHFHHDRIRDLIREDDLSQNLLKTLIQNGDFDTLDLLKNRDLPDDLVEALGKRESYLKRDKIKVILEKWIQIKKKLKNKITSLRDFWWLFFDYDILKVFRTSSLMSLDLQRHLITEFLDSLRYPQDMSEWMNTPFHTRCTRCGSDKFMVVLTWMHRIYCSKCFNSRYKSNLKVGDVLKDSNGHLNVIKHKIGGVPSWWIALLDGKDKGRGHNVFDMIQNEFTPTNVRGKLEKADFEDTEFYTSYYTKYLLSEIESIEDAIEVFTDKKTMFEIWKKAGVSYSTDTQNFVVKGIDRAIELGFELTSQDGDSILEMSGGMLHLDEDNNPIIIERFD